MPSTCSETENKGKCWRKCGNAINWVDVLQTVFPLLVINFNYKLAIFKNFSTRLGRDDPTLIAKQKEMERFLLELHTSLIALLEQQVKWQISLDIIYHSSLSCSILHCQAFLVFPVPENFLSHTKTKLLVILYLLFSVKSRGDSTAYTSSYYK